MLWPRLLATDIAVSTPLLRDNNASIAQLLVSVYLPLHTVISYHSLEDRIVKRFMAGECRTEALLSQKESRGYQLTRRRALRSHGNEHDWTPHNADTSKPHAEGVHRTFKALHRKVSGYCMETFSQLFAYAA